MATTTPNASPLDRHASPVAESRKRPGKATAAMVLGVIAVLAFLIPIASWIVGGAAIALALTAKSEIRRRNMDGLGFANAGLVLGIIGVLAGTAMFVAGLVVSL